MHLDPNFGGMFLQVTVKIASGGGAIIFGMRKKIKAFFKKNKNVTAANVSPQIPADELIDMLADGGDNNK